MTTDSGHDFSPFRTTVVDCHKRCGRHLVVKYPDVAKIDTDWLCPICDQDQRDAHFSAQLEASNILAEADDTLERQRAEGTGGAVQQDRRKQAPADVLDQCEAMLGQARVLYEQTLDVQRENVMLKAGRRFDLQRELLDLITLMPDSQTQELVDHVMALLATRAKL